MHKNKLKQTVYQYRVHSRFTPIRLYYQFPKQVVDNYLKRLVQAGILHEVYVLYSDVDIGDSKVYTNYQEIPFGELLSSGVPITKEMIHIELTFRPHYP